MTFDPTEAQRYLSGVDYPVTKQDLIKAAEENGAPQEMIERLQAYDDERFQSPAGVQGAFAVG